MGTNFSAWTFQIARYQVMAFRQRQRRDRHVFDEEAIQAVTREFERRSDGKEDRLENRHDLDIKIGGIDTGEGGEG